MDKLWDGEKKRNVEMILKHFCSHIYFIHYLNFVAPPKAMEYDSTS